MTKHVGLQKKTKIVCTLGPACDNYETILAMVCSGMDVVRLNASHGTLSQFSRFIRYVRRAEKETGKAIGIMLDLQGPKIRTGNLASPIDLKSGQEIALRYSKKALRSGYLPIDHDGVYKFLKIGCRILLNDGTIQLRVKRKNKKDVICEVLSSGRIHAHKGLNLPGISIPLPTLMAKDKNDLQFGLKKGVDYVALSFVRSVKDVEALKKLLGKERKNIHVIAKIERPEALKRFNSIAESADGLIIARGDLGLELPLEQIPMIQKKIIKDSIHFLKPVITATQMLASMEKRNRPTRAEVMDVANAVLDGTDAVMLSEETAIGKYPVLAVQTMARIIHSIEKQSNPLQSINVVDRGKDPVAASVASAAGQIADLLKVKWIISYTISGSSALQISKSRPKVGIVALTPDLHIARRMSLFWGVSVFKTAHIHHTDSMIREVDRYIKEYRLAKPKDVVVLVAGLPVDERGITNFLKVHEINR